MPQPPSTPHNQPSNRYHPNNPTVNNQPPLNCFSKPVNLPDFLLTALSLFLFVTAPKHHLPLSTNRRFVRFTSTMSQTLNPNSNPNPNFPAFPNPQSLSDWLKPRLPSDSFASWGTKPGTKNVHNLWLELADGETSLIDKIPPIRNLEVVCVRILRNYHDYDKRVLIESHQELSDGSIRKRDRPLSEKLKAGEDIEAAVKRAIKEELGSLIFRDNDGKDVNFDEIVKVLMDSYERRVEERASVSYPGLPACYVLHTVDAFVEGLPEGEFVTEEGTEYEGCDNGVVDEAVAVKKHFWRWVPADSM